MRHSGYASLLLAFIFLSFTCLAQPTVIFDDWGKVTIEELKMTECSFEKNADALLLLDLAQIDFSKNSSFTGDKMYVTSSYYQRFKVFTEKGLHRASFKHTVSISSKEEIKNIRAVSYNLIDGQIRKTELNANDIHTTKLNEYQNQVSFSVPDVKAGSVFEMRYDREQLVTYTIPQWYFTSNVPSIKSSITIDFVDDFEYYVDKYIRYGKLEEKSVPYTSDIKISTSAFTSKTLTGNAITYTAYDLHSYQPEPYTNSSRNYMNRIGFQLSRNKLSPYSNIVNGFGSFVQQVYDNTNLHNNLTGNGISKKELKSLINESMSDEEKGKAIFEFFRSNLKWNGNHGYIPQQLNGVIWKNKVGSRADINCLLINTLRQAGLKVYPVLTINKSEGYVNKDYPMMEQYKGLDALLILPNKELLLDATAKYLPFGTPPIEQLNTSCLIIRGGSDGFAWHEIKDNSINKESASIIGEMDESGHMTGEMTLYATSYSASSLINLKALNKSTALNDYVKARIPNATIESVRDSQDIDKCTFYFKVKFSAQAPADNEGNIYLSVPTLYGNTTNTFVNAERTADIDMGYRFSSDVMMQIKLPDSYVLDSIVPSVSLSMQDTSIVFLYDAEALSGTLVMRQKMEYHNSFFPVSEYPGFYDFFQKYYSMKQKPVVLKKKT